MVALACGALLVPLCFAAWARGAEPRSSGFRTISSGGASLKWRASGTKRTEATPTSGATLPVPAVPTPELLPADDTARPLDENTAAARIMRDEAVTPAQANSALDDPFGDKRPTTVPRLLTQNAQPTPAPAAAPPARASDPTSPLQLPSSVPANLPPLPPAGDQIAAGSGVFQQEPCPKIADLKAIGAITNRIAASEGELPRECYFDEGVVSPENRHWALTHYHWKASGLCHKPLYFEEVALERYGHSTGPFSQPIVSGAHFFGSLAVLPYKMGMNPPTECQYALGYYRPGSCAPYIIPGVPLSARGAASQAAFLSGIIWLWP